VRRDLSNAGPRGGPEGSPGRLILDSLSRSGRSMRRGDQSREAGKKKAPK
jgi:hypothetical protein